MGVKKLVLLLSCLAMQGCALKHEIHNFTDSANPRYAESVIKPTSGLTPGEIKIVSYNIRLCGNIEGAIRLLQSNPDLNNADIVCLQEVCPEGIRKIALSLGYNYAYYPSYIHPSSNKESGTAVLAKWPINKDIKVILPGHAKDKYYLKLQQTSTGILTKIHGKEIAVFSVHLGVMVSPEIRNKQLNTILERVPQGVKHVILAGDFNTYAYAHKKAIYKHLKKYGFNNATGEITWTYKYWYLFNKKAVLDYVFTKGFDNFECGTVLDRKVSDHLPVWARLKINK